MHALGSGAVDAIKKIKALGIAFSSALIQRIASYYAIGILYDWHLFTWFFIWSGYSNTTVLAAESWGWLIELTPAFIGSGMLVGLNVGFSFFGGTVFAWGILGPLLVQYGICTGRPLPAADGDPRWDGRQTFWSMSGINQEGYVPSPRYWFLWPGVLILVCYSMTEFLVHIKVLWYGVKFGYKSACRKINAGLAKRGKQSAFLEKQGAHLVGDESALVEDFAKPEDQVPTWVWTGGTVVMIVVLCIIGKAQFDMGVELAIMSCILGVVFAFLSIHGAGVTDIAPLSASAKASQLVFGGITSGQGLTVQKAQTVNLIAGGVASGSADMSCSLVGDFRVGFLLQTPPVKQFWAQAVGTFIAMFLAPGKIQCRHRPNLSVPLIYVRRLRPLHVRIPVRIPPGRLRRMLFRSPFGVCLARRRRSRHEP
jgi:uncharacterized oligopeptide transporter (OPT) family protein